MAVRDLALQRSQTVVSDRRHSSAGSPGRGWPRGCRCRSGRGTPASRAADSRPVSRARTVPVRSPWPPSPRTGQRFGQRRAAPGRPCPCRHSAPLAQSRCAAPNRRRATSPVGRVRGSALLVFGRVQTAGASDNRGRLTPHCACPAKDYGIRAVPSGTVPSGTGRRPCVHLHASATPIRPAWVSAADAVAGSAIRGGHRA